MKGSPKVIEILNEVLTGELTAINQYFLHSKILKDWGYNSLASYLHKESVEEMKHADELVERILFIEGMPNLQKLNALRVGEKVEEMLKGDLDLEMDALETLRRGVDICWEVKDHASRELLEKILTDEEEHVDWIESQFKIIEDIGVKAYMAEQMGV